LSSIRRPRVLLIGWDAADWQMMTPLMDQGLMPTLNSFCNRGVMGNLATIRPVLSPMLWNSIATGKRADQHGILGFTEPDPHSGGVRPVSSTSRKSKAIWNILNQSGYRSVVVDWFAGHPAEKLNGVVVSPLFHRGDPVPEGSVHPAELEAEISDLRLKADELDASALLPFLPHAAEIDFEKHKLPGLLANQLAKLVSTHAVATHLLSTQEWDFGAVYYEAIDRVGHFFMPFHPPKMDAVPLDQFRLYRDVMTGIYRFHDMMLESLLHIAGPETTVIICSDHGFLNNHLRPLPGKAGPVDWHRALGMIAMDGPDVQRDERIYGATLLDIAPTILHLFGLPAGADMDGKVLVNAFRENAVAATPIASWEQVPGDDGTHPAELRMDPETAAAVLEQFIALGYVAPPSDDETKTRARCVAEQRMNLAEALTNGGKLEQALAVWRGVQPAGPRVANGILGCLVALQRYEEAEAVLRELPGEVDDARKATLGVMLSFRPGREEEAAECLTQAEASTDVQTLIQMAGAWSRLHRGDHMERLASRALELDPENPQAIMYLATRRLRQKRWREAAELSLSAVGILHFLPWGHVCLGAALIRLGELERARTAIRLALQMRPGLKSARRWLAVLEIMLQKRAARTL